MVKILGVVPARGGSKGIPGKNIKPFVGKPLITWTIEAALDSNTLDRVIISTDDNKIKKVAEESGGEVPFIRPAELATDTASSYSVAEHALTWLLEEENYMPDCVMLLQPTSALRTAKDIKNTERIFNEKKISVVSVCEPQQHPFLMRTVRPDGTLTPLFPESLNYTRRQEYPRIFAINGAVYLIPVGVLKKEQTFIPKNACPYIMSSESSVDIDTPFDFFLAEQIQRKRMNTKNCFL